MDVAEVKPGAPPRNPPNDSAVITMVRRFVLALFVAGVLGMIAELLLLGHNDPPWQPVPLVLLALSLAFLAWRLVARRSASLRLFQVLMILFVAAGLLGLFLHCRNNAEFELEMKPSLHGLQLLWKAIRGTTPALAPGMMIYLGLLGLIYTYRHPALPLHRAAYRDSFEP